MSSLFVFNSHLQPPTNHDTPAITFFVHRAPNVTSADNYIEMGNSHVDFENLDTKLNMVRGDQD